MIKITNLSKIYDGETPLYALDDVNLSFENKGLVFIVGKSGSGKSTLLNMIAGFDVPTFGKVEYCNQDLKMYSPYELDNYRNSAIGFVFQDFCLIETLTVYQNIKMAFDFKNKNCSKEKIDEILSNVEMNGYGKRYPRQLSAGQKQRIAIARAVAKDAKIILADEPTGNLDSKTTIQILNLLKKLSEDRLVIIVSHNKEDAFKYADRIIEIGSGKIISDKARNLNYTNQLSIDGNKITLPNNLRLNKEQLNDINLKIKQHKGKIHISKCDDEFIPHSKNENIKTDYKNEKTKMGFFNMLKYSYLFFKNQVFSFIIIVLIVTFLVTTLSISLQFAGYDGTLQYEQAMENSNTSVVFLKQESSLNNNDAYLTEYFMSEYDVSNDEQIISKFERTPYKITNICLPITTHQEILYKWNTTTSGLYKGAISRVNNLIICDQTYLNTIFADENGNIKYIGDISSSADGIIITDFVADKFLKSSILGSFSSYEQLIDSDEIFLLTGINITGIVITDYQEEYGDILTENDSEQTNQEALAADVYDVLLYQYGVAYTLNPTYYETYINDAKENLDSVSTYKAEYSYNNKIIPLTNHLINFDDSLKDNEVMLSYSLYNSLFDCNVTPSNSSEFEIKEIDFSKQFVSSEKTLNLKLKIVGLSPTKTIFSSSLRNDILNDSFFQVGVAILDATGDVITSAPSLNLYVTNSRITVVKMAIRVVRVFKDLFTLLTGILIIAIIVIILVNSITTINKNIYNIGISRSMGAHMGELGFIYSSQMILFGALTIVLSLLTDYYSTGIIDKIIVNNISKIISVSGVKEINYVVFNPVITAICIGLIVILTIISILIPIYTIKKANPVNIIKSRD